MSETVSIIIPNYNGKQLLEKNLPEIIKIKKFYKEIIEIIVVDDNSTDASCQFLDTIKEIKLFKKTVNTGFSDTVNKGIKESKGTLVLLLNTDVKPNINFLPPLLAYFGSEKTFAVGCLDNSLENGKIVKRGRGVGTFKNGYLVHKRGDIVKNNTLWVSGGSSIYRKSILKTLGGFDSVFNPFYWEDIDLSYRALKSGYNIYFEKSSQVLHEHQYGAIINKYSKQQILGISLQNQILFVWKNISKTDYLVSHLIYLIRDVGSSLIKGNLVMLKALLKACVKLPVVIMHRIKQAKTWIKSDDQVLEPFRYE